MNEKSSNKITLEALPEDYAFNLSDFLRCFCLL